ncbi:MAG TPA: hypothetical protein VF221_15650, partial [Chloroflexota bacterium]
MNFAGNGVQTPTTIWQIADLRSPPRWLGRRCASTIGQGVVLQLRRVMCRSLLGAERTVEP